MIVQAVKSLFRDNLKTALLVILVIYIFSILVPYLRAPRSERSVPSLTWSPTPGAPGPDRAALIQAPQDALNVRLTILRKAQETLDITYYSIRNDQAGQAFAVELLYAADRGVRIRLLLDGKLGLLHPKNRRVLAVHENIELKCFSPLKLYAPWRWNDTLHDKFIVADGRYLLLGGRNMESSQYLAEEEGPFIKHDWDVLVTSELGRDSDSVIRDAAAYYEELWSMDRLETVPVRTERQRRNAEGRDRRELEEAAGEFREGYPAYYAKTLEDYASELVSTESIRLIRNPLNTGRKDPWIAQDLQALAAQAREQVLIQTPYATADRRLLEELGTLADKTEVIYLTNSPGSTPNLPAFANYYFQRRQFVETGIRIHEFQSTDSLHGKAYLLDSKVATVGSFNLDSRSRYISTESMLVIDSEEFAQALKEASSEYLEQSLEVGPDNAYLPNEAVEETGRPLLKRILAGVLFVLLKPVEFFI